MSSRTPQEVVRMHRGVRLAAEEGRQVRFWKQLEGKADGVGESGVENNSRV